MFRQFMIIVLSLSCFIQVGHSMPSSAVARDVSEGETDAAGATGSSGQGGVMGAVNSAKDVGYLFSDQLVKSLNQLLIGNARALTALGSLLGSTKNGVTKGTSSIVNVLAGGYEHLDNAVQPVPIINTFSSGMKKTLDVSANTLNNVTKYGSEETNKMFQTLRDSVDKAVASGLSSSGTQGEADSAQAAAAA